jgi:hypothetical protein
MPKFVLVDNSLDRLGGHHFEFAADILEAAERIGFAPVIGASSQLPPAIGLPAHWPIFRIFPDTIYHGYNLFCLRRWEENQARRKDVSFPGPLRRISDLINTVRGRLRRRIWIGRRARTCRYFLTGCRQLFEEVTLEAGDVVMLPIVSDVELEALGELLRERPETALADWRLLFHTNYLEGRLT